MEIVSEIGDSTLNGLNYIGSLASLGGRAASEANQALTHIDAMVGENRADVRQAVLELRRTLTNMTDASARLDQTLDGSVTSSAESEEA